MEIDTILACAADPDYFIDNFCWIENKVQQKWVRFNPWEPQREALKRIAAKRQVIILKARQGG